MKPVQVVAVAVMLGTFGDPVLGQAIADITGKGGTKLAKNEVQSLVSGATLTGPSFRGRELTMRFEADGSANGSVTGPGGRPSMTFGTWRVNDEGQLCERFTASSGGFRVGDCFDVYQAGSEYFLVLGNEVFQNKLSR